jgi:radical SAM family uncharacterized protein/radical SAM-linked protein
MQHPYFSFIHSVQKPARYLGGEYGQLHKPWDEASCRICLAFPDLYELGMSHLGLKILYSAINRHPRLLAERVFAPWFDMEAELRHRKEPLRSLESARPLRDFDVVGFSLQFELAFTNILQMLELGGIPLHSQERSESDPLVLAGGPGAVHPEPIAPFIDAFLVGDGEEAVPEILNLYGELTKKSAPRAARLRALAAVKGVYVPSLYQTAIDARSGIQYVSGSKLPVAYPVQRRIVSDLDRHPFPVDGPVPDTELAFDRASIEIARGCSEGCRFCQAGQIYRPVRERSPLQLLETTERLLATSGYEAASLTSLSTADYSAIAPLIHVLSDKLSKKQVSLVVSSLRAYGLDPQVLADLRRGRATGLTFALEAGTQRLRDVINKNVTEEQMLETARQVFSRGWDKIKLYFMIGLPTERDEDVLAIISASQRIRGAGRQVRGRRAEVVVNVSIHVPKPHTPFQWVAMDPQPEVERKQRLLLDEARRVGLTLRLHSAPASWLEAVLARGDRAVGGAIEAAYRRGARFDSWSEQLRLDLWQAAFAETGIDPNRYLAEASWDGRLPWDHIHTGVEAEFLRRQYQSALAGRSSPPCAKPLGPSSTWCAPDQDGNASPERDAAESEALSGKIVCYQCGIGCDLPALQAGQQNRRGQLNDIHCNVGAPRAQPSEPVRVRLAFSKLDRAIFASHLDLIRGLTRVCRRAGLALYYTQGFHPKALMSFAPALSVGIASLSEYLDIALQESGPYDCADLPARLSKVAPQGLSFSAARRLDPRDAKLSGVINQAVYVAAIPRAFLRKAGLTEDALREMIALRKGQPLTVERVIEGVHKQVRVSDYLVDAEVGRGGAELQRAELGEDLVPIELRLRITGGGTAKASEALAALLERPELPAAFVRTALLWVRENQTATPLDLEALRKMKVLS